MGLRFPPTKNHYFRKTRHDFGIENWQEDLDLWYGVPTTKQHWGKENRENDKIQTACVQNERATSRLQNICVVPIVVRALGGGIKALKFDLKKIFDNNELLGEVVAMMQKKVLMDSESIVWRVIQGEDNEYFFFNI